MKYEIIVTIEHPDDHTHESEREYTLKAYFSHDPNTYGNGWYVCIRGVGKCEIEWCIDLRYHSFNPDRARQFLDTLCREYWTGKDGAYRITSLSITKATP